MKYFFLLGIVAMMIQKVFFCCYGKISSSNYASFQTILKEKELDRSSQLKKNRRKTVSFFPLLRSVILVTRSKCIRY